MTILCSNCGEPAGPERWRTMCRACFRYQKVREEEATQQELDRLRQENFQLKFQAHNLRPLAALPKDRIRQLLQLCHPDKHHGSKIANEVTQWLIEQKERSK